MDVSEDGGTWANLTVGNLRESSENTWFICWHGAAHGAQKLSATTCVGPADLRKSWNCSMPVISCTAVDAAILESFTANRQ